MFTRLRKAAAVGVVATVTAASLTACMSDGNDDDSDTIRIGVTEAGQSQWTAFEEKADEEGVDVEIVPFSDYIQPNRALTSGQLDVNQFQHIQFLADYNIESGEDLVPFGATSAFPMGLYVPDGGSLEDVKKAGEVIIPDDTVNQGRAIKVLAAAGLLTVRDKELFSPTPADIDADKSDVKVTTVESSQTAIAYKDGTPAVINNNYLEAADVTADDAVFADDPDDPAAQPYINVWVSTKENADKEEYQKLVEIWNSDEVQEAVQNDTSGSAIPSHLSADELKKILADTEQKIRDQDDSDDADE